MEDDQMYYPEDELNPADYVADEYEPMTGDPMTWPDMEDGQYATEWDFRL
jgi:hypothetical protein